ncbi:hypothetical protein G7Y89_g7990 [Cudoniella acicularis]|uniref:Uncharacterized protein n=1 Tax=Cudoniella acicularis TaxID=354080 RepID=A0A8H4RHG9_9HELO|nr:hypothetical protein G7Y89_g7990 [Cudoniella acicularis]
MTFNFDTRERWPAQGGLWQHFNQSSTRSKTTNESHRRQISEPSDSVERPVKREAFQRKRAKSIDESCPNPERIRSTTQGIDRNVISLIQNNYNPSLLTQNDPPDGLRNSQNSTRVDCVVLPDSSALVRASTSTPPHTPTTPTISGHRMSPPMTLPGDIIMDATDKTPTVTHVEDRSPHVGFEESELQLTDSSDPLWDIIQRRRVETWSVRSEVHETRAMLREKQTAKSNADDALYQHMRKRVLLGADLKEASLNDHEKSIETLMQACQLARDEYGPLEDDCNRLEDKLSGLEFKLARLEEEFYNRPKDPMALRPESVIPAFRHPPTETAELDFEDLKDFDLHPLVDAFQSKLGDMDILRERLHELMGDKEILKEEKEARQNIGLDLDTDDQAWLDNYPSSEAKLREEIETVEKELDIMRRDCFRRGLIDENDEPTNLQSQEKALFSAEEDINPQDQVSEYVKYPLLLPRPGQKQGKVEELKSIPDAKSDTNTDRINQWLLDQLRNSPLDVMLLASIHELLHGVKIKDHWEMLVLAVWYKDGTFNASHFRAYPSSLTTHASGGRPRSFDSADYHF